MHRRATFIHDPQDDFNPKDVQLKDRQMLHPGLKAAREERLTFGFDDLPSEIIKVLQHSSELHIRWISENAYDPTTPYLSSLTSGLHVHYTPSNEQQDDHLCSVLKIFSEDLKCISPSASFTRPTLVSERFASSAALQYHAVLPSLTRLVAYMQQVVCPQGEISCFHTASLLNAANYIDFDYDSISHTLVLTAFWSKPLPAYYDPVGGLTFFNQWPLDISSTANDKVEVGIMMSSKARDRHELQLEGFLAVVGEHETPKPTLFSFPSRHHALSPSEARAQAYTSSFEKPTGLHPILKISFPSAGLLQEPKTKPEDSTCALHTYLTLPSGIFADQYAFPTSGADSDPLFQQANNILSLRAISGELDLEAPDYVVDKWGSTMLIELATPTNTSTKAGRSESWDVTIPLHLRYRSPSDTGFLDIQVPWPIVFWACTAEDGTRFPINPFDRTNLGYDGLFGSRTMFYHVPPLSETGKLVETISVPVLSSSRVGGNQIIELGTVVVILLGFAWVMLKLWPGVTSQLGRGRGSSARTSKESTEQVAKKQR